MSEPLSDEELAEWEKLFGSAREGDDDTILNLCAIGWKLIQEVRRLREELDSQTMNYDMQTEAMIAERAHSENAEQRAKRVEAEVERLRKLRASDAVRWSELEAERDRYKAVVDAARDAAQARDALPVWGKDDEGRRVQLTYAGALEVMFAVLDQPVREEGEKE